MFFLVTTTFVPPHYFQIATVARRITAVAIRFARKRRKTTGDFCDVDARSDIGWLTIKGHAIVSFPIIESKVHMCIMHVHVRTDAVQP